MKSEIKDEEKNNKSEIKDECSIFVQQETDFFKLGCAETKLTDLKNKFNKK